MVCEIGAIAKTKAMGDAFSVIHFDWLNFDARHLQRSGIKNVCGQTRPAGFGWPFVEDVLKSAANRVKRVGRSVNRDIVFLHEIERAHIVKAENMVGMGMGVKDSIQAVDVVAQGLVSKVGCGIDEDALVA